MTRFYNDSAFADFIQKHVLPGNGENIYHLLDDGSVSEFTNAGECCPAEYGHIIYSVRRDPEIKTAAGYIGMYRRLDECGLL